MRGRTPPPKDQPFPSVEPAFDFAVLDDPSDASVRPAFDRACFDGFAVLLGFPVLLICLPPTWGCAEARRPPISGLA